MTVIVALLIFMVVICLHELGHFFVAKKVDIKVVEFSVGMGPALHQRVKGETTYSLRALPLGGYCAMEGEDEEEGSDDPRSYDKAKPGQRFLTILAGPLMNLLIAYICFFIYLGVIGNPLPVIGSFSPASPLEAAGLQTGDEILAINGQAVKNYDHMKSLIQEGGQAPLTLDYRQGDQEQQVKVQPIEDNGAYYLGFTPQTEQNWWAALGQAGKMTGTTYVMLFHIIGQLISGQLSVQSVSGPVGIIAMIGDASRQGFAQVMYLMGYISLNLAFFNLLPIPALDGSKLLLIAIEKLSGKKMSKKAETRITLIGFALLMALFVLITFQDIRRLVQ